MPALYLASLWRWSPTLTNSGVFNSLFEKSVLWSLFNEVYTAISRKVVAKSACDNPERYCGWFRVHCSSRKFRRMAREAMDVSWRLLKESNKSRLDSYSVRNSVLIISHITRGFVVDCLVLIFSTTFLEIAVK